jgi:hypothetical protein
MTLDEWYQKQHGRSPTDEERASFEKILAIGRKLYLPAPGSIPNEELHNEEHGQPSNVDVGAFCAWLEGTGPKPDGVD